MFTEHEIKWTHEKSNRMWNYFSRVYTEGNWYFSEVAGDMVLNYIKNKVNLRGKILDFGCGAGFLIEKLLKRNLYVQGFDFSEASVNLVNKKYVKNPKFMGAVYSDSLPTPLENNSIDVLFLIETIEHVLPEALTDTLKEINRVVKRGGNVIITTPNNENLNTSKIMCPDCGCIFHRVQHVRSWSASSLISTMKDHGFVPIMCTETAFRRDDILNYVYKVYYWLTKKIFPNLVYIGQKE